jgi:outer membrane protein OmpA-like peptidoglycan-associated protein
MAEDWLADVRKYAADADEGVVGAIVRYCGIALQSRDSSLVAMSDKKERELVRENYLKKKLGLVHSDADLDEAVVAVGQRMKEDRTKNRVTVYYLLAEHFGLLSLFGGVAGAASAVPLAAAGLAGVGMAAAAVAPTPDPVPAPAPEPVAPAPAAEPVAAYSSYDNNDDSSGGGLGWLKWLLLAAVLALLLFFLLRSCSGQEAAAPVAEPDAAAAGETADAANTAATPAEGTAGATAAPVAPVPQGAGVVTGEIAGRPKLTVYFDTGKSAVTNDLATAASGLKDYMAKNPAAKIAVSGYNDPTGNAAMNSELSKKRAQGVAKALEAAGIAPAAINLEKPAATTDTAVTAAEARRVEVVVKP